MEGNLIIQIIFQKEIRKASALIKDTEVCEKGYHVTNYWNMWVGSEDNRIFEVEVDSLKETDEIGVIDKYVCGKFRFIKEVKVVFDKKKENNTGDENTGHWNTGDRNTGNRNTGNRNTGHWNTGDRNTGHWNTGNRNTGDRNTGHWNTGHWNTGDQNTGDRNTGDQNTGDQNTGDQNTGDQNTGDQNTGNRNTGHWNTGNRNTGHWNTGHWNTGDRNTGRWNTSDFNTGFFNTKEVETINVFNKDCRKEVWDKCEKPNFICFDIEEDYQKSFIKSFRNATKEDVKLLIKLPNFDYAVFEEISGISEDMIKKKLR